MLRDNFAVVLFCVHGRRCIEGEDSVLDFEVAATRLKNQ